MSSSLPQFRMATVTTAAPAQVGATGVRRLIAVSIAGGSAASKVEFKNAATDTGTVLLTVNCLTNDNQFVDLSELGGISFDTAIFCKPAGTGAIVYVWYE